ncbi:MAG: HAD family hydrolase [Planctomycetota bacterium]|nr:HAD family hydrolase [Planctomycetota bacterium]
MTPSSGSSGAYRALLLDLDGTLIGPTGSPHPETKARLDDLIARGVHVMIATGRSEGGTRAVMRELGFTNPAIVFNGAGLYCPVKDKLIEERTLADRTIDRTFEFTQKHDMPMVVMRAGEKFAREPKSELERSALVGLEELHIVPEAEMPRERLIRITMYSDVFPNSAELEKALVAHVDRPAYFSHFPLNALYEHVGSPYQVVDVQPPCRGKGEAVRYLHETHGVLPEEIVAIGDATNDISMFQAVGLAIAMGNAMPEAAKYADRQIGDADSDTIAKLIDEVFPCATRIG